MDEAAVLAAASLVPVFSYSFVTSGMAINVMLSRSVLARAIVLSTALGTGCSFLTSEDVVQCVDTAECTARGGAFKDSTCLDGVCVNAGTGGSGGGVTGCQSNAECQDANDGLPFHCIEGACVNLLSADCSELYPPNAFKEENSVLIGYGGPLEGGSAFAGTSNRLTVQMALKEIEDNAVGLPMIPDAPRSKFMAVMCDTSTDPNRAFSHLIDTLKIDAVVCGDADGQCLTAAQQVALPAQALFLSPWATVPWGELNDNGLVVNFRTSHQRVARAYVNIIQRYEQDIRTELGMLPAEDIRVAAVHVDDNASITFMTELEPNLIINGELAVSQLNTNYKRFSSDAANPQAIIDEITNNFQPHLIMMSWFFDPSVVFFQPVEAQWPTGVQKPYWLSMLKELTMPEAIAAVPEANPRVRGVWYRNPNTTLNDAFNARYFTFSEGLSAIQNNDQIYDAVYTLAFSYVLNRNAPELDGATLASGIFAQDEGTLVDFDGGHADNAINVILAGNEIDSNGTFGTLDFDPASGDMLGEYESYCFTDQDSDGVWEFTHANQVIGLDGNYEVTGDFCCPYQPTDCQ